MQSAAKCLVYDHLVVLSEMEKCIDPFTGISHLYLTLECQNVCVFRLGTKWIFLEKRL